MAFGISIEEVGLTITKSHIHDAFQEGIALIQLSRRRGLLIIAVQVRHILKELKVRGVFDFVDGGLLTLLREGTEEV